MGNIFSCFTPTNEVTKPLITDVESFENFNLTGSCRPQKIFNEKSLNNPTCVFPNIGIQYNQNSCYFDCVVMLFFGCNNHRFLHLLKDNPTGSLGHMILTQVVEPLQSRKYVPSSAYEQIRQKIMELTKNYDFLNRSMDIADLLNALDDHIPSWKLCSYTSSTNVILSPLSVIMGGINELTPVSYLKTLTFSNSTSGFFIQLTNKSDIAMDHTVKFDDKSSKKFVLKGLISRNSSPHFTCFIYDEIKQYWIFFDDNGTSDHNGCVPVVIQLPSSFQKYLVGGCIDDSLIQITDEKGISITVRVNQSVFAFYSIID